MKKLKESVKQYFGNLSSEKPANYINFNEI